MSGRQGPPARLGTPTEEGAPIDLDAFVSANLGLVVGGLGVLVVVLLVALLWLWRGNRRLARRLDALARGSDGESLEAVLASHLDQVRQVVRDVDAIGARTSVVEHDLQGAFGRAGLVRFNPFEDTGGNQSFALAMVDGRGDGFVMSSLHSRTGTRIYAKAISRGASEVALSAEEADALRRALAQPPSGSSS